MRWNAEIFCFFFFSFWFYCSYVDFFSYTNIYTQPTHTNTHAQTHNIIRAGGHAWSLAWISSNGQRRTWLGALFLGGYKHLGAEPDPCDDHVTKLALWNQHLQRIGQGQYYLRLCQVEKSLSVTMVLLLKFLLLGDVLPWEGVPRTGFTSSFVFSRILEAS